jgi:hypothetical protein
MAGPPWQFSLGEANRERAALAADLISAGKIVDLGGISVRLENAKLEVAIYIESSLQAGEVRAVYEEAVDLLTEVAGQWPVIGKAIEGAERQFVLLNNYGMGAVLIGHWQGQTFIRNPHAPKDIRTP